MIKKIVVPKTHKKVEKQKSLFRRMLILSFWSDLSLIGKWIMAVGPAIGLLAGGYIWLGLPVAASQNYVDTHIITNFQNYHRINIIPLAQRTYKLEVAQNQIQLSTDYLLRSQLNREKADLSKTTPDKLTDHDRTRQIEIDQELTDVNSRITKNKK